MVAAIVDNEPISLTKIDSIIDKQLFELRIRALKGEIAKKILAAEARKTGITVEKLRKQVINSKDLSTKDSEVNKYIHRYNINDADLTQIRNYIKLDKQNKILKRYIDSLLLKYDVRINLSPQIINEISTDDLIAFDLNKPNKKLFEVLIISTLSCPSCLSSKKLIDEIIENYHTKIHFKYVHYNNYIDLPSISMLAANQQKVFYKYYNMVYDKFSTGARPTDSTFYFDCAKKLDLNIEKFQRTFNSKKHLRRLINNSNLIKQKGIYSTPTFVVNGKVLDGENNIFYLQNFIEKEINNIKN